MKIVMLVMCATLISLTSFAQTDTLRSQPKDTVRVDVYDKDIIDGVMMTSGTMKLVKGGVITQMNKDIVMSDGTTVQSDGTIVRKNNSRIMFREGQHMDMNGKISMVKDSRRK